MDKNIKVIEYKKSFTNRLFFWGIHKKINFRPYSLAIAGIKIIPLAKNWFEIFMWHIFKGKKSIKINMRNGISFVCSGPADLSMLTEIWSVEEYNPIGISIEKDYTVIDIGAHVGFFSIYAAYHAKKGKIYSYEPFKENYEKLLQNINMNKFSNIKAYNMAVASKTGKRKFYPSDTHNGCHSLLDDKILKKSRSVITIRTVSLDDIFKNNNIKKCDFLKMDCEGAEVEIICAASSSALDKIRVISGELHAVLLSQKDIKKMVDKLKKNNFSVTIKDGLFFALKNDAKTEAS